MPLSSSNISLDKSAFTTILAALFMLSIDNHLVMFGPKLKKVKIFLR